MRTRTPPYRESNHRNPIYRSPKEPLSSVLMSSPELMSHVLPPIPPVSMTPSLRQVASSPDLHKAPSSNERPSANSRHVSFHVDTPEFYIPSVAESVNPSPMPPTIQRRWPHTPFSKRKSTVPCSQTPSRSESNTVACNYSSSASKSSGVHDLPLKCFDQRCECHGCQNNVGCDEHGMMNLPQLDSPSEGSSSTPSSLTMSLRLPSVRKAFIGRRRPTSVSPRTPALINVSPKEQSEKQKPIPVSPGKKLPSSPTFSTSGEVYRAEYVNPFRMKKSNIKPSVCRRPTTCTERILIYHWQNLRLPSPVVSRGFHSLVHGQVPNLRNCRLT
ncbi:hypothetical protein K503DRAFT_568310 [Rhizopogon vinicolor AM-OR11-026]|uniref:Uncharacterized protein n=1 Tax=Rhizopogon vinicolor AM-OR11-026 TaxID=1314800 RepID=A0A1B7N7P7_9AGAM|nr:hypothetical protein K503DRAFT_568310 [Rhizopogon vinicolor AM-OR11-026]